MSTKTNPWSDPDIIAQIDALAGDKSAPADAMYEAVCAEAERNSRNSDPAIALRGRLVSAVLPPMFAISRAVEANDAKTAADNIAQLADAIGFMLGSVMMKAGPKIGETFLYRAVNVALRSNATINALAPLLRKAKSDSKPPGGDAS